MSSDAACIRAVLAANPLPRREARLLLAHVLQRAPAWLLAHDDEPLAATTLAAYQALAARRVAGEPMAYLLGEREFMGHRLRVTPEVLIPRPETEHLVECALAYLSNRTGAPPDVVDLGTGSGAVAISVALACQQAGIAAQIAASDASAAALAVARENAARLGAAVSFWQGDWYAALPLDAHGAPKRYDLILANPPYIAGDDPHLQQGDLRHEPRAALSDGADGLGALRLLAAGAPDRLKPGGAIWLEHGWDQAACVRALLRAAGLRQVASLRDLAGIERLSGGYV